MERNKKTPLRFLLLLAVFQVHAGRMDDCPSQPNKYLSCYTDYNQNISCVWNSTNRPVSTDTVCTLQARRTNTSRNIYKASCFLEPDVLNPSLRRCTLDFKKTGTFQSFHVLSISLGCEPPTETLTGYYRPSCHVKLSPPGKPLINLTTVSWFSQVTKHGRIRKYNNELQWKQRDQSWSDPKVQTEQTRKKICELACDAQLDAALFERGHMLQVRVRVKPEQTELGSVWSDWSPTASDPSDVLPDFPGSTLGMTIAGAAVALVLAGLLFKIDKAAWVYKKIRFLSSPDPGKSFLKDANFQSWLGPHFTAGESFHYPPKLEDISSVEVISSVDAVRLCSKEAATLEKMRSKSSDMSTSSGFSNPSYSQLCPPAPVSLTGMGTIGIPNGLNASQGGGKSAEQEREEILQLLSKGNNSSSSSGEPVQVISDYEKVEKLQVERQRLQSLDSGMCSGEEVSQESLEADSISATESQDVGEPGRKEREKEGGKVIEVNFQELFGGSGNVIGQGSIQVCSDYEQVQRLQPGSPELCSLDSGVSGGSEEQVSQEENLEEVDKSTELTTFLSPSPPPSALPCPITPFPQLPLKFCGADLSRALPPSHPGHIMERMALMSASRSVEPSGDGYMPVRQETD